MELRDIKRLIRFAQRNGIKRLKMGELSFTFQDGIIFPFKEKAATNPASAFPGSPSKSVTVSEIPAPPPVPSLDEINAFIYGNDTESH